MSRVRELLDAPADVVDASDAVPLAVAGGAIRFEQVSIDLGRGDVLRDLSFAIEPGEMVAIVGPSGIGKSTIADLIVRLLDPDTGRVTIDGHDLRSVQLASARAAVAVVEQDPILFHASIAHNVAFARPDAEHESIRRAAIAAGLGDLLSRLPDGMQTIVGERGQALSAGERQRVAIARTLLARHSDRRARRADRGTRSRHVARHRRDTHDRAARTHGRRDDAQPDHRRCGRPRHRADRGRNRRTCPRRSGVGVTVGRETCTTRVRFSCG